MIKLNPSDIVFWFNAIRDLPDAQRTRALDAFWAGQLDSKVWLVEELNKLHQDPADVYIFGGWIGVLASILFQASTFDIRKVRSIDIDPWCESIADMVCKPYEMDSWKFKARTADMCLYDYETQPDIVINTSTEHISQEQYDIWYSKVPTNTLVVIQGNDFFNCEEHVRCSEDLNHFMNQNKVKDPLFAGHLQTHLYKRFMCIWRK